MFHRQHALGIVLVALALWACERDSKPSPAGSGSASRPVCVAGPVEPQRAEAQPAERLLREQRYAESRAAFEALIQKYPESANLLVWRGDADLNDDKDYLGSAERALAFYDRARALSGKGCHLSETGRYYVALHSSFAHLRRDDAKSALRELEGLAREYPESAEVRYNLARTECLKKQGDACYTRFQETLEVARARTRPKFLRTHYSVADWIRRSESQSEFEPLRSDARYSELVKRMLSEP
jgi:predicted Zn-dependent protease